MGRKLGGFSVVALVALALGGSITSASGAEFTSTSASTPLTGTSEGKHILDVAGLSLTCESADFTGTLAGTTTTSVVLTAKYSNCKFFLNTTISVNMNGCAFRFHASGTVDIVDDSECNGITFEAAGCKVTIPKQTGLHGNTYTNANGDLTIAPEITGLKYTSSGCPENGEQTNGNYTTGPVLLEATNGAYLRFDVEPLPPPPPSESEFTSSTSTTPLTGVAEGHHVVDASGTSLTCGKADLHGTQTGVATESLVMTATYSECKFLFVNVSVNMNGCAFRFQASGTVDIVDDSNCKGITFESAGCKVVLHEQGELHEATYEEVANGDITITPEIAGLKYTSSGCLSNGELTNGTYTTGTIRLEATNGASLGFDPTPADTFTSSTSTTPLTGVAEGHHVVDASGTSLTCGKADLHGSQTGARMQAVVMTATYAECKFLFVNVSVNMNGCAFRFHASGTVDIVDDSECNGITFEAAGCKVTIPEQSSLHEATYEEVANGDITITPELSSIHYTAAGCLANGTRSDGNYTTGPIRLEATNGATLGFDPL